MPELQPVTEDDLPVIAQRIQFHAHELVHWSDALLRRSQCALQEYKQVRRKRHLCQRSKP